MKNIFTFFIVLLISLTHSFSQTATDFTANDCAGASHHLFAELNAGKVIVFAFVMPCASCIGPSLSAFTAVKDYATSNPGRVVFYMSDDIANTSCGTVSSWATTNGMPNVITFSSTLVKESDYGAIAMPKIVVLGGWGHKVFFTADNSLNATNLKTAINSALLGTGLNTKPEEMSKTTLFPNPATTNTMVSYSLSTSADIAISVYSLTGQLVKSLSVEKQAPGRHSIPVDLKDIPNGTYLIKIASEQFFQTQKIVIAH